MTRDQILSLVIIAITDTEKLTAVVDEIHEDFSKKNKKIQRQNEIIFGTGKIKNNN